MLDGVPGGYRKYVSISPLPLMLRKPRDRASTCGHCRLTSCLKDVVHCTCGLEEARR